LISGPSRAASRQSNIEQEARMGVEELSRVAAAVADDSPRFMGSMVARPLSELPAKLRPRRSEPASADGEYDVLHFMK
jgi:hypothetical protein